MAIEDHGFGVQNTGLVTKNLHPFPAFPGQRLGQSPPRLIIPENVKIQAYEPLGFLQSPKNLLEGRMSIL